MFFICLFLFIIGCHGFIPEYFQRKKAIEVDAYVSDVKYKETYNRQKEHYEKYYLVTYSFVYNNKRRYHTEHRDLVNRKPEIGDCTKFVVHNNFVGTIDGHNAGFYRSIIATVLGLIGVIRDWDTVIIILKV